MEYVYLVVWQFAPSWVPSFYRLCEKKGIKGTRVDDLLLLWCKNNYEEFFGNDFDGPWHDLMHIAEGTVRDALAIPREIFLEIISELGLKVDLNNCLGKDLEKIIIRIADKYILSQNEKQSFLMTDTDSGNPSLYTFFIGEDYAPIAMGYSLADCVDGLEELCSTTKHIGKPRKREARPNERLLNAVKDIAFGKHKTRVGFLDRLRDRINAEQPNQNGYTLTEADKRCIKLIKEHAGEIITKGPSDTDHFTRATTIIEKPGNLTQKALWTDKFKADGTKYLIGLTNYKKKVRYWTRINEGKSPVWLLKEEKVYT